MEYRVRATGAVMLEGELRQWLRENDGPSFDLLTPEVLEAIKVDPVLEGPQATPTNQYEFSMRAGVELVGGQWFTKYVLGPVFQDTPEISAAMQMAQYRVAKDQEQGAAVRRQRNAMLSQTDWTQVIDAPVDQAAWAAYRQELRNIPEQAGFPWSIVWPDKPEAAL